MFIFNPVAVALFLALGALADHKVTFRNNCPFKVQPMWKRHFNKETRGKLIGPGKKYTTKVPEIWDAGRFFVQDPKKTCRMPDGEGCTLLECSFGPEKPRFWQCNISVITGFNVPMKYKFTNKKCNGGRGFACAKASCPIQDAYRPEGCDGCLKQCNTNHVGVEITLCQAGAPIPKRLPQRPKKKAKKPRSLVNGTIVDVDDADDDFEEVGADFDDADIDFDDSEIEFDDADVAFDYADIHFDGVDGGEISVSAAA
ncbi:hypothetical protein AURDEDRAFT_178987 [Auricularia subglabra TFB-10046 SS5]|nr:hypothetical protein AURDEDRAFT_178987 [Auricularia subglabra TFB-10046 SS5]